MSIHTDFKFHPQVTQIGCYWGGGGHSELYLLEGDRLAIIDTGCVDTPKEFIAPALETMGCTLRDIAVVINTHGHFDHAGGDAQVVAASGAEPATSPLFRVEPADVLVTMLKPSDDGKAWIIRLFGASGEDRQARIVWPSPEPKAVFLSDLSERPGAPMGDAVTVPGWDIATVRAEF